MDKILPGDEKAKPAEGEAPAESGR